MTMKNKKLPIKGIKHYSVRLARRIMAVATVNYDKQIWIAKIGIVGMYGCDQIKTALHNGEKLSQYIAEAIFRKQVPILKEYGFKYKEKNE